MDGNRDDAHSPAVDTAAGLAVVTDDTMIRLDGVSKRYADGTVAVHELSLDVARGEIAVLIGPSGCGKTTTMRMINRLVEPSSGRIVIDGDDVTTTDPVALRRRIGYVIQQIGLFPHQTIRDNVGSVPTLLGWKRDRVRARVDELLELVDLDPAVHGSRYPHELSGGQRQRVGVARALAADPPVLLMDEPFGAVDPIGRERLQREFRQLQQRLGTTVVFVTHDIDEAVRLGDRIGVMSVGGRLEQYDTPARILGEPATPFVADFVGGDRMIKRLAVTPIDRASLDPLTGREADDPSLPVDASLHVAMATLLATSAPSIVISDDAGPIGRLSLDRLHEQLRAHLAVPPTRHESREAPAADVPQQRDATNTPRGA
jgi:osmoprotectant transport system ATP-binding protein